MLVYCFLCVFFVYCCVRTYVLPKNGNNKKQSLKLRKQSLQWNYRFATMCHSGHKMRWVSDYQKKYFCPKTLVSCSSLLVLSYVEIQILFQFQTTANRSPDYWNEILTAGFLLKTGLFYALCHIIAVRIVYVCTILRRHGSNSIAIVTAQNFYCSFLSRKE